ncbi:hypothetical protein [Corynebacterium mastitidis]|uniref:hypothetical protein n=1 Tax=Corynebacterium mastitidis TaxID=161890 RepID=UPI00254D2EAA|nr:hypothetical protein [Corynebacterium mastitidis]MDK8449958.1 hypothetical protein [Corynebacterium mastitidis]
MPGQHRTEAKSHGATITTIIVIILVILAVVWWLFYHKNDSSESSQAQGACENPTVLHVAEQYPGAADMFLRDFSEECVTPELVSSPSQAQVYVAVDSPAADAVLAEQGLSRSPEPPKVVGSTPVGLSTPQAPESEVDPQAVYYGNDPAVAQAAASALAGDPEQAESLVTRDAQAPAPEDPAVPLAVTSFTNPEGRVFTALPGAELTFSAIEVNNPNLPENAAEGAHNGEGENPDAAEAAPAQPQTLFLLDASAQMAPQFDATRARLAEEAAALEQPVALWNYSSPLNPGVTRPWRDNVGFGPAQEITPVLNGFGTGGVPLTRTSVLAALRTAAEQAQATGQPARVVLFTSGTAPEDLDDAAFGRQLASTLENPQVSLEVVQVGDQVDRLLAEYAR